MWCSSSPRATPASSPTWTGPRTASTSSPTQETTRSSSVGAPPIISTHPLTALILIIKISISAKIFKVKSLHISEHDEGFVFVCLFLFFSPGEASSGKHVTNMDTVRNLEWATHTCTLAFNTFGRSLRLAPSFLAPSPTRSPRRL